MEQEMEERRQQLKSQKIASKHLPKGTAANLTEEVDAAVEKREIVKSGLTDKELERAEAIHNKLITATQDKYKELGRKQAKKYLKGLL